MATQLNEVRTPMFKDMHVHLRQAGVMQQVTPVSAAYCSHVLPMPNLASPITNAEMAQWYAEDITRACGSGNVPELCMTLKLTQETAPDDIMRIPKGSLVRAVKIYPDFHPDPNDARNVKHRGPTEFHAMVRKGRGSVTTNAHGGVYDIRALAPVLEAVRDRGLVLCVHAADPYASVGLAENSFLLNHFKWLTESFAGLRIVIEHVSTGIGVEAVKSAGPNVAATITFHHLLLTHEDVVGGKIQPHHHCMPTPNHETDMQWLLEAATSGDPKFFFGSDTAPHAIGTKECASGCAGVYTAPVAHVGLVQLFEQLGQLDRLPNFVSGFAGEFYDLTTPNRELHFVRKPWIVGRQGGVVPFLHEKVLEWQLDDIS